MCKHGNNNNKTKAKEEYLNCQSKLRNELGKEETKRNDDKLMTLIHSGEQLLADTKENPETKTRCIQPGERRWK